MIDVHRYSLLEDEDCWELRGRPDSAKFFTAVAELIPDATTLFLEAGSMADDVSAALYPYLETPVMVPERGTAWPKGKLWQLPATGALLGLVAALAERHAVPELCDHLHVYRGRTRLLEWYDAFNDPFYVSGSVSPDVVRRLAAVLGLEVRHHRTAV